MVDLSMLTTIFSGLSTLGSNNLGFNNTTSNLFSNSSIFSSSNSVASNTQLAGLPVGLTAAPKLASVNNNSSGTTDMMLMLLLPQIIQNLTNSSTGTSSSDDEDDDEGQIAKYEAKIEKECDGTSLDADKYYEMLEEGKSWSKIKKAIKADLEKLDKQKTEQQKTADKQAITTAFNKAKCSPSAGQKGLDYYLQKYSSGTPADEIVAELDKIYNDYQKYIQQQEKQAAIEQIQAKCEEANQQAPGLNLNPQEWIDLYNGGTDLESVLTYINTNVLMYKHLNGIK
ncbi:MAG: hypothetical protein GX568_01245 [Candidatus Gastranaerophilales bacterium]|nr:hypothetical protein [Candidatus Gastranaerophilales bacterium]